MSRHQHSWSPHGVIEVATPVTTPIDEEVKLLEDIIATLEGYYRDTEAQKHPME